MGSCWRKFSGFGARRVRNPEVDIDGNGCRGWRRGGIEARNPASRDRSPSRGGQAETRLRRTNCGHTSTQLRRTRPTCAPLARWSRKPLIFTSFRPPSPEAGTLHIRTKGGGQDRVFLNPALVRMLGRFLGEVAPEANTGPNAPLFRSRWGTRLGPRPIQLRLAALCRVASITRRVSIHSVCHTVATRLCHKTGDLHLVQRALGHRQITTTEVYAQVSDDSLRKAVASRN
jgi:hypothetical protein